jgi:hypothetical protein
MALDVLFASIGDRMVDYSKVDLAASDHTEAILMDAAAFHEKMNIALVRPPLSLEETNGLPANLWGRR